MRPCSTPANQRPRPKRHWRLPLALLFGASLLACQGPFSSGLRAFEESRYPDAARELRRVDPTDLSPDERTRLALYAGLTELSLGNQQHAIARLQEARCGVMRAPESLTHAEYGRLSSAWQSLGRMPGEPLAPSSQCSVGER